MMKTLLIACLLFFTGVFCVDPALISLTKYVSQGVVCLDGSTAGYYYRPGVGSDANNWIIHMEGGGWCTDLPSCYERISTVLGSSKQWPPTLNATFQQSSLGGFLSDDPIENPHFSTWNMVFMAYCDGTSLSSNLDNPILYNNKTLLYFRGARILEATIADLQNTYGLNNARTVVATGCSAGGLATYIHLDRFRAVLPSSVNVVGLADAGFFLDHAHFGQNSTYTPRMQEGFALWNSTGELNQDCVNSYPVSEQWKCIFAQYTYPFIKTPVFILNSKYDSYQILAILGLNCVPWDGSPFGCNATYLQAFLDYGSDFQNTLLSLFNPTKDGMWVGNCVQHCESVNNGGTLPWSNFTIDATTPNQAFYNWLTTGKGVYLDSSPYSNTTYCP